MNNFEDLFRVVEQEVESARIPPRTRFNVGYYTKMAKRIALEQKCWWIVFSIFISAALGSGIFFQQLQIGELKHTIAKQNRALSEQCSDSVQYNCPHCLKPHTLQLHTFTK